MEIYRTIWKLIGITNNNREMPGNMQKHMETTRKLLEVENNMNMHGHLQNNMETYKKRNNCESIWNYIEIYLNLQEQLNNDEHMEIYEHLQKSMETYRNK